ncbi:MAG: M23 family metallopeptidase [Nitrospirae bacterium]|nr:M23 family metallopeptidase [Nitrospirota bacterium]
MNKEGTKIRSATLTALIAVILAGFAFSEKVIIPVAGASGKDWNQQTFWSYPWGVSGVHKGIDIFASEGTAIISSTPGIVVYAGYLELGGNVIAVLDSRCRIHYYAHLKTAFVTPRAYIRRGQPIGSVGATGNAMGKPPHLHYAVITTLPYIWKMDRGRQGWKKMFFLNPAELLTKTEGPAKRPFRSKRHYSFF